MYGTLRRLGLEDAKKYGDKYAVAGTETSKNA